MRSILVFLLAVIIFGTAEAQMKADWKEYQLKGKVKSLKARETYRYKKNGVFTEWEKTYGRLILFNSTGSKTEFKEFYGNDSLTYRIAYQYNAKEKQAELSYFNREGKLTGKTTYQYNDKGDKIEERQFTPDGQPDRKYTYGYDERANLTEMTGYRKDGTLTSRTSYAYDNKNNRKALRVETPGYASSSREFTYDDKGNISEEIWYNGADGVDFRFVRSYDGSGNKTQELKYRGRDRLLDMTKWTYEYDKTGNWIKRTTLTSDGVEFQIEDRTLVYY